MKKRALIVLILLLLAGAAVVWAQSTGITNQEVQRFTLPSTNTTGWRVHTDGTVMILNLPLGSVQFGGRTFAQLPGVQINGAVIYCSDCTIANPCAGSGTGAIAKRLNNVWVCN